MHFEARFSAVGGQGIILAGTILADSAFLEGKYAAGSPTYTAQVRGGPTKVDVIIDDNPILFPRTQDVDFFLSLATNSYNRYYEGTRDNAIVLIDPNLVTIPDDHRQRFQVYEIPVIDLTAKEMGRLVYTSAVCLGAMIALTNVMPEETVRTALVRRAPKGTEEYNLKAFSVGFDFASSLMKQRV